MKLAAVYNVFDAEELLPYSISSIRNVVDTVIVVYQTTSNLGRPHPNPNIKDFIETLPVDHVLEYEPKVNDNSMTPEKNERLKRALGARLAGEMGCTHFLLMDCDEFYEESSFIKAKQKIIELDCDATACQMNTYYKSPKFKLVPEEKYFVPFITKLKKGVTKFANFHDYPVVADPTRKTSPFDNFYQFSRDELIMHHYTMIRKDMMLKFANHTTLSRQHLDVRKIYNEFVDFKFGDPVGHPFQGYNLEIVDNIFNIPETFEETKEDCDTFDLVKRLSDFLDKEGFDHWLSSGTFLSLYRENRFFPWDIDIDIDLNGDTTDFESFVSSMKSFGCDLIKKVVKKGKTVQFLFKHPDVSRIIDFYVWYEGESNYYSYCDVGTLYYDKTLVTEVSRLGFRDTTFPCPPPEEYFTLRYGSDWRIPKRVSGLPGGGWDITKNLVRGQ